MTGVVYAPSRREFAVLRPSMDTGTLRRSGVGRRAALRTARAAGAEPVVVAGIAGGLAPQLRTGDVVVGTEVRSPGHRGGPGPRAECRGAPLLAAQLRRAGLTVHLGPVVSHPGLAYGAGRASLAATGALCVDMESAWLLAGAAAGAVVRVVADPDGEPLLRPATVGRLRTALDTLARCGPVLQRWARATGPRQVMRAEPRSFCAGVVRAVDVVDRAVAQRGAPVYVRRQIVHNAHVVNGLRRRGAVFVDELDEVPPRATVVFAAHGVAPGVQAEAAARGLAVIDATCPLVTKVHTEVRRFADRGDTVLFVGHAGHEETVGTMGERPDRTVLVQDVADAAAVRVADPQRVSYLVQTTLAVDEVAGIVEVLRDRFPALRAPATDDICYATTNRQQAVRGVAEEVDVVLVVGSANSSNSLRLVETARRAGTAAYLIDDVSGIELEWLSGARRIGLSAGASAPASLVDEVVEALSGLGPVEVDERVVAAENLEFTLPKEVREA